jgi:hypothetical protein
MFSFSPIPSTALSSMSITFLHTFSYSASSDISSSSSSSMLSLLLSSSLDFLLCVSFDCSFTLLVKSSHDCYENKIIMHAYYLLDIYIQLITLPMLFSLSLSSSLDWLLTVSLDCSFKIC